MRQRSLLRRANSIGRAACAAAKAARWYDEAARWRLGDKPAEAGFDAAAQSAAPRQFDWPRRSNDATLRRLE